MLFVHSVTGSIGVDHRMLCSFGKVLRIDADFDGADAVCTFYADGRTGAVGEVNGIVGGNDVFRFAVALQVPSGVQYVVHRGGIAAVDVCGLGRRCVACGDCGQVVAQAADFA